MPVRVQGLAWLGTRTDEFDEMCRFYGEVFGLPRVASAPGFAAYRYRAATSSRCFAPTSRARSTSLPARSPASPSTISMPREPR